MIRFVARRLLWAIPTLLIVTFLVFVAVRIGTDPVATYIRSTRGATPERVRAFREANGLVGSIPEQYFRWLGRFLTGDWAPSIRGSRPVWPELKDALANTLVLGLVATIVGVGIGVLIGVLGALRPHSAFDTASTAGAFVGLSIPPYVSAVALQLLFSIYMTRWLGLSEPFLPTSGVYPPGHSGFDLWLRLKHLVLPASVVALQTVAVYSRYMRASLIDVLHSDYVRTARSKGISERRVVIRHACRNALIPLVTFSALDVGAIVGGLVITERIFKYGGMGDFFLTAFDGGDFPQLMPWLVIVVGALVLFNLLADLAYAWLDPRTRQVHLG